MKSLSFIIIALLIIVSCNNSSKTNSAGSSADKVSSAKLLWETPDSFKVPESVKYDAQNQVLYVANMNEDPEDNAENGFISKLDLDGNIIELKWITGLITPKGMGIINGKLYVADDNRVAKIDIGSGVIEKFYVDTNAKALNDIDITSDGQVFISDWEGASIYTIKNDSLMKWLGDEKLNSINGIFTKGNELYAGVPGKILKINVDTKEMKEVIKVREGMIDGLEAVADGKFLISDWGGKVHLVSAPENSIVLVDKTEEEVNAADLDFISGGNIVVVPTFFNNKVMAYKLDL